MKINWFSPLPPLWSGIAEYAGIVLPILAKYGEVVAWTTQQGWDEKLESFLSVRQWTNHEWSELNEADLNVFHIGNNSLFHDWIFAISKLHSGVMILHDYCLQDFFADIYQEKFQNNELYRKQMFHSYGPSGIEALEKHSRSLFTREELLSSFPLAYHAVEKSLGVIVHNQNMPTELLSADDLALKVLPLPFASQERGVARKNFKQANRNFPFNLILFGILGANRQLGELLRALASFPSRDKFFLHIYGEVHEKTQMQDLLLNLQLTNNVELHGFVEEKVLEEALQKADIAINLRFPSMGEVSYSQLRIWSHSLPSLVTKTGWYATLPEETVYFVRPGNEETDIHQHLTSFLSNPVAFSKKGKAGFNRLIEKHQVETYVRNLIEFGKIVKNRGSVMVSVDLAEKCGNIISNWSNQKVSEILLPRIAKSILYCT